MRVGDRVSWIEEGEEITGTVFLVAPESTGLIADVIRDDGEEGGGRQYTNNDGDICCSWCLYGDRSPGDFHQTDIRIIDRKGARVAMFYVGQRIQFRESGQLIQGVVVATPGGNNPSTGQVCDVMRDDGQTGGGRTAHNPVLGRKSSSWAVSGQGVQSEIEAIDDEGSSSVGTARRAVRYDADGNQIDDDPDFLQEVKKEDAALVEAEQEAQSAPLHVRNRYRQILEWMQENYSTFSSVAVENEGAACEKMCDEISEMLAEWGEHPDDDEG